jgi:AAHS family 4-hydroxybenzoate transporter-like MFS transporter
MPLGALMAGLISSVMLPKWGWQSIFYMGGILPLMVTVILITMLPESVRFLSIRGADTYKISRIMARISPEFAAAPERLRASHNDLRKEVPVKDLFTGGRALGTILLWVPYVMNLLVLFFIVSWLPALLEQNAMPVSAGVAAISLFSLGGIIGSVGQSPLMKGFGSFPTMLGEFIFCTVCVSLLAFSASSFPVMISLVFILGCCVQGAQAGLNALVVGFYPTAMRSTGMGWASAVGRIGSISGPVLGGILLSLAWSTREIFLAAVVPALCAAVAVVLSYQVRGSSDLHMRLVNPGHSQKPER